MPMVKCKNILEIDYVPYRGGDLSRYVPEGNDLIVYTPEYAKYQYYGVREDGTHLIKRKNRTRVPHPLATSYWDLFMWRAHGADITKEVQDKIEGKI